MSSRDSGRGDSHSVSRGGYGRGINIRGRYVGRGGLSRGRGRGRGNTSRGRGTVAIVSRGRGRHGRGSATVAIVSRGRGRHGRGGGSVGIVSRRRGRGGGRDGNNNNDQVTFAELPRWVYPLYGQSRHLSTLESFKLIDWNTKEFYLWFPPGFLENMVMVLFITTYPKVKPYFWIFLQVAMKCLPDGVPFRWRQPLLRMKPHYEALKQELAENGTPIARNGPCLPKRFRIKDKYIDDLLNWDDARTKYKVWQLQPNPNAAAEIKNYKNFVRNGGKCRKLNSSSTPSNDSSISISLR